MYASARRAGIGEVAACDPTDPTDVFGDCVALDPSVSNGSGFDATTLTPTMVTTTIAPASTPVPVPTAIQPVNVYPGSVPVQLPTLVATVPAAPANATFAMLALAGLALWGSYVVISEIRARR
jgi:hypothetical protein